MLLNPTFLYIIVFRASAISNGTIAAHYTCSYSIDAVDMNIFDLIFSKVSLHLSERNLYNLYAHPSLLRLKNVTRHAEKLLFVQISSHKGGHGIRALTLGTQRNYINGYFGICVTRPSFPLQRHVPLMGMYPELSYGFYSWSCPPIFDKPPY
jgi:hypothetical protein